MRLNLQKTKKVFVKSSEAQEAADSSKKLVMIESRKTYKKVLCSFFRDNCCQSGDECQKAHGLVELRDRGK